MSKLLSRRIFQLEGDLSIICDCEDTRSGFRHLASVLRGGSLTSRKPVKICYLNRTWEPFEFKSVLNLLADKAEGLSEAERVMIRAIRRNGEYNEA